MKQYMRKTFKKPKTAPNSLLIIPRARAFVSLSKTKPIDRTDNKITTNSITKVMIGIKSS